MKRGSLVLLGILVVVMLFIAGCGGVTITCNEGETRCSSSHDSIIQCSGNKWNVIQNCADPNPVCKVVNGTPQCTTNSAPVVNAGNDFSVSGNTGTLVNFGSASSTWPAGKIGTGLFFNNGYNRVEVPDSVTLGFRDKITVSAWVKFNYYSTLTIWNLIATKGDTSNERAFGMWVIDTGEDIGEILLSYKGEDLVYYNFQVPGFTLGNWNHIIGVIDTVNNYMEIYINNIRYRSTGNADLPPIKINNFPVYIGGINGVWETIGSIDEIAILNDALTADEVNQAYQSYQSGVRPGLNIERLQLYYTLDEGTGTTAFDSSNNVGKTVTLSGSATDSDNDSLTYSWNVVSAPVTNLEYGDQRTLNPWFIPTQSGVYIFRLNVNDGATTTSDDISITVGDGVTTCTDGTSYGLCSTTKPLYCDNGVLINNCLNCGCDSGKTCQTDGSCLSTNVTLTCADGTLYNSCSITKPLFCNTNGTLLNDCQNCGCDSGKTCQTDGSCLSTICTDGTSYGLCSTTKPLYCDNGVLINNCLNCGCDSGKTCQTDGSCLSGACSDGTSYGLCSTTKPLYCDNGVLINDCLNCGCDSGKTCQTDGLCFRDAICTDSDGGKNYYVFGTASSQINGDSVDECQEGTRWLREAICNDGGWSVYAMYQCPISCSNGVCYVPPNTCKDGTPYNSCSTDKPLFCNNNGNLINDCQNCGCDSGEECRADGLCLSNKCIPLVINGDPNTKLDILYIGDGYTQADLTTFASDANIFKNRLLEYEPFTSQSNKINFYRIDNTNDLECKDYTCNNLKIYQESVYCPHDQIIVIMKLSYLSVSGYAYMDTGPAVAFRGSPVTAVHEFGHSFGGLYDEYSFGKSTTSQPVRVNCASENTCSKWNDLMGVGGVGCYQTCGYTNWYRPRLSNSIMFDAKGDYNPVGERKIRKRLEEYS